MDQKNWMGSSSKFPHPNLLLSKAREEYTSFLTAQAHSDRLLSPQPIITNNQTWSKSPAGYLKENWDVACREVVRLGFGAIIRNDKGVVVGTMKASINFNSSPLIAKALGLLLTTQFCKNAGLKNLILECDSLQIINQLHSRDIN